MFSLDPGEAFSYSQDWAKSEGFHGERWSVPKPLEILKALMNDVKTKKKDLILIFADVSKAFDSVSHEAILNAAMRLGVPQRLLEYLRTTLEQADVRIGRNGEVITKAAGVNQGDPPSGNLFNFVMDLVYRELDTGHAYVLPNGTLVPNILYADNGLMTATLRAGEHMVVEHLVASLAKRP